MGFFSDISAAGLKIWVKQQEGSATNTAWEGSGGLRSNYPWMQHLESLLAWTRKRLMILLSSLSWNLKKLHPKNDHEETFHTWDTNTSCLPYGVPLKSFQQKIHNSSEMSIFLEACPASISWPSSGQLTVGKRAASNPAESLQNPSCLNFKYNYCACQKRAVFFWTGLEVMNFVHLSYLFWFWFKTSNNLDTCHW